MNTFMVLEVHRGQLMVDSRLHICVPAPKLPSENPIFRDCRDLICPNYLSGGVPDIQLFFVHCYSGSDLIFNHTFHGQGDNKLRAAIPNRPFSPSEWETLPQGPKDLTDPPKNHQSCTSTAAQRTVGPHLPTSILWDHGRRYHLLTLQWCQ